MKDSKFFEQQYKFQSIVRSDKTLEKITLVCAGGKMGMRLTHNLRKSSYVTRYLEVSAAGNARLPEAEADGISPTRHNQRCRQVNFRRTSALVGQFYMQIKI
jgi:hypothetical protein